MLQLELKEQFDDQKVWQSPSLDVLEIEKTETGNGGVVEVDAGTGPLES